MSNKGDHDSYGKCGFCTLPLYESWDADGNRHTSHASLTDENDIRRYQDEKIDEHHPAYTLDEVIANSDELVKDPRFAHLKGHPMFSQKQAENLNNVVNLDEYRERRNRGKA